MGTPGKKIFFSPKGGSATFRMRLNDTSMKLLWLNSRVCKNGNVIK